MARREPRRAGLAFMLVLSVMVAVMVVSASAVYAVMIEMYPEEAARVGGTGPVEVGHGYMVVEDFAVYDNTSGGLASTYIDTVILGYRLAYSLDNGTYTVLVYFNNSGYFDGVGSASATWSDNETTLYFVGGLPDRYPQGDVVYVVTKVRKEG